jgi:hypothetical protein
VSAQGSLFGQAEVPGGGKRPAPRAYAPSTGAIVRKPNVVFGEPDKRGKYWYERFHAELQAIPEEPRKIALNMILFSDYDRIDAVRKILDRYCRAHVREQDNFREAMGE